MIGGSAAGALEARRSRRRSLQQLPGLMQLLERGASCWQPSYALARRSPWSYRYEVRLPTAAAPARSKCSMCASQSDSCVCPHRVFRASSEILYRAESVLCCEVANTVACVILL